MAQELEELPLFPLDVVVFPYSEIQLHIFEPRYREMVSHCLDFETPFGIVLIREHDTDESYLVGTVCRIVESIRHADGRFDIKVRGERRFRVRKVDRRKVRPLAAEHHRGIPQRGGFLQKRNQTQFVLAPRPGVTDGKQHRCHGHLASNRNRLIAVYVSPTI